MTCSLPTLRVNEEKPLQLVVELVTYSDLGSTQVESAPRAQLDLTSGDAKGSGSP